MSFEFLNQLPTPADIKRDYPLSPELRELKKHRDLMISDVITGKDSRVLVIIGPCSADNEDSVCDYVSRLTKIQEDVKDQVILVPRIYTNKPRTTGEGYKGIASQPDPEKAPDMIEGGFHGLLQNQYIPHILDDPDGFHSNNHLRRLDLLQQMQFLLQNIHQ